MGCQLKKESTLKINCSLINKNILTRRFYCFKISHNQEHPEQTQAR